MTTNNQTTLRPPDPNASHPGSHSHVHYPAIRNPLWWGPVRQIDDVEEMESLTRQGWCLIKVLTCQTLKTVDGQTHYFERVIYVLGRAQQ